MVYVKVKINTHCYKNMMVSSEFCLLIVNIGMIKSDNDLSCQRVVILFRIKILFY